MTSTLPLFGQVHEAIAALRRDLIDPEDGPQISTMRNYRFAIVQYDPKDEFPMRAEVQKLIAELVTKGWYVLSIDLQKLLLERIRAQGDDWLSRVIDMEKRTAERELDRGLNYLKSKLMPLVEGPKGLAGDCKRLIKNFVAEHPDEADRTLVLIGRAGGLYPFFRSSALLRHLDGQTDNVPVVLLYPGSKQGPTSLSFMGLLAPDSDYRPRIYP
jgi:hypothetical protein